MNKLSNREKALLIVLILIIVVVGWLKLIYEPVNNKIATIQADQAFEESESLNMMVKVKELKEMKAAIEELKQDTSIKPIPKYNNKRPLMAELNKVMAGVDSYSVSFGLSDRDGYIINRTVNLSYSSPTYAYARYIIEQLAEETYTNQITSVSVGTANGGSTSIGLSMIFFEVGE